MSAVPARAFMSIGEVLDKLRPDFPDVTISKIRFLESEGLVEPQRTPSGYRKFTSDDLQRLRYVLAAQREQYLPLKVIKSHLEAIDRGLEPPDTPGGAPRVPMSVVASDGLPTAEAFAHDPTELRLSRDELIAAADIEPALLDQLCDYGLIQRRAGSSHYDGGALMVARAAAEMAGFGIEPRHLRAFKSAAEREVGLIEQVVTPMARQRGADAQARAQETVRELAALSVRLHAALVKAALDSTLRG
jgi:DNA-binding transcriptional MerR regulator